MSLFDRIFQRKVPPKNLDAVHPPEESALPVVPDKVSHHAEVEDHQVAQTHLTTATTAHLEGPVEASTVSSTNLPKGGGEVAGAEEGTADWQALPHESVAPSTHAPSDVNLPIETEPTVRKLALLRIAIALRQVLTERLFEDLASSKLEIASLCGEALDRIRIESPANEPRRIASFEDQLQSVDPPRPSTSIVEASPDYRQSEDSEEGKTILLQLKRRINELESENAEIRSKEGEGVSGTRFELRQQQQQINEERERLEKRIQEVEVQSRRLSEREAVIYKNFSELQRREQLLATASSARIDAVPKGVATLEDEVRRLRAQIDLGASSAKKREATLLEEIRALRERVTSDAVTAAKKQTMIQKQLEQADHRIQSLLKEKNELERSLEAERWSRSPRQKTTNREAKFDATLITVSDHRIIDWMLEEANPEQAGVDHGYLSLTGEWPWSDQQIRELMEGAGFSLWKLPDVDVDHVIVGRRSWDVSAIEEQIEARQGRRLRIYSQEMWFAKLVTGRDPFDSGDHDLLMAFAKGHPALEYLIRRDTPWPDVSTGELVVGDGVFTEGIEFGVNSPLRNFGYQVGLSSGLSVAERRALLVKFLEAKDLPFDGDASDEYRSHWGRPRSVQRLFRVASHIRWLIGWQGKSPNRAQANQDWRSDLQWLKKTYYKPDLHRFRWPTT